MADMKNTEAVGKIVEILSPFESVDRLRVIQASLMLLGEAAPNMSRLGPGTQDRHDGDGDSSLAGLSPRVQSWLRQSGISEEDLQQAFHFEAGVAEFIAGGMIPGANNKEKTINAFVLAGLAKFLSTGNSAFDDKAARALCEASGCYDSSNHSYYIRSKGNDFAGSKERGWTLTAPGLKRGADLVKMIAGRQG